MEADVKRILLQQRSTSAFHLLHNSLWFNPFLFPSFSRNILPSYHELPKANCVESTGYYSQRKKQKELFYLTLLNQPRFSKLFDRFHSQYTGLYFTHTKSLMSKNSSQKQVQTPWVLLPSLLWRSLDESYRIKQLRFLRNLFRSQGKNGE